MAGIDRISGSTPYDSNTINRRVQDADGSKDDSGFRLLSDEAEGVIYEPGKAPTEERKTIAQVREEVAREEREAARANLRSRFDGPGVAVELSTDGVQAHEKPAQQSIGDIFRDTWHSIVNFFLAIWNGGTEQGADGSAGTASVTESDVPEGSAFDGIAATEEAADSEFGPAETEPAATPIRTQTNSAEDITAFLADYGGRHLAKNSDLLTQYDRTGHIVSVDPSDRRRILQGEGRVRRF